MEVEKASKESLHDLILPFLMYRYINDRGPGYPIYWSTLFRSKSQIDYTLPADSCRPQTFCQSRGSFASKKSICSSWKVFHIHIDFFKNDMM